MAGEFPKGEVRTNPALGGVPGDFADIVYTALETKLEQLATSKGDWPQIDSQSFSIPMRDRSLLAEMQTSHDSRMGQSKPRLHANIEQWAMYYADTSDNHFPNELLMVALTVLPTKGSSKKRLLALEALAYIAQSKDGHQKATQSYWGRVRRHGDFAAQEMTIDCFHFQVIDCGDSIPIQDALMRSAGNVDNVARNQCVLLRLAAGMCWSESGRPKRAPCRGGGFRFIPGVTSVRVEKRPPRHRMFTRRYLFSEYDCEERGPRCLPTSPWSRFPNHWVFSPRQFYWDCATDASVSSI